MRMDKKIISLFCNAVELGALGGWMSFVLSFFSFSCCAFAFDFAFVDCYFDSLTSAWQFVDSALDLCGFVWIRAS